MNLVIDDPEFEQDVRALSAATGEPEDVLLKAAVRERLARIRKANTKGIDWAAIREIQQRVARMPVLDDRPADELVGYNEYGTFD